LYWRTDTPLPADYTVFIHLRAADGFVRAQADSPPVGNHYPTSRWRAGEVVQDIHPLPTEADSADHIAIGLYNLPTGERLPAFAPDGSPLPDDAFLMQSEE
ncbi:MAG: hypothetical protein D6796_16595, partial [Caldilineae bacterium]